MPAFYFFAGILPSLLFFLLAFCQPFILAFFYFPLTGLSVFIFIPLR